ncbi:uncharacterized protein LOC130818452 [Amaranthus tricolor]|uniref:uncharacterized protein LOC130818452 n=1 Tax=Amaranthus tricolor TaxID=29722 RepID=UPI00258CADAA|nr:uncharacterized protein LOC130818452 [Amaranthus tricolor]
MYAIPNHPQSSGQVEISNHDLKLLLEKMLQESRKNWSDKLDDALWAYRMAFKTPIGTTPFREKRLLEFNDIDEIRLDAYESNVLYKKKTKKWHDRRITSILYKNGVKGRRRATSHLPKATTREKCTVIRKMVTEQKG